MILIRGIKGEAYARKIEKGIVGCRDILSTVLQPPVTGYEYSDYYEKNFVKAITFLAGEGVEAFNKQEFLYRILIDSYIPHIYITYFHILNPRSLEWLDKFDDDYQFIALDVKLDRITRTAIGNGYFGARMAYVDSIRQLKQEKAVNHYVACQCSLEGVFENDLDMAIPVQIYNTLSFSLLCREQDEKFTDLENEFRIIAYDCPNICNGIRTQIPRKATIQGENGSKYDGVLRAGENTTFTSGLRVLRNPEILLSDILKREYGKVTIDSKFKEINIGCISDEYRYLGSKTECARYIKKMIARKVKDTYVNRTVRRAYKIGEIPDAIFTRGYSKVEY